MASTTTPFRLVPPAKKARLQLCRTSKTRRCRLPTCPSPSHKPAASAEKDGSRLCRRRRPLSCHLVPPCTSLCSFPLPNHFFKVRWFSHRVKMATPSLQPASHASPHFLALPLTASQIKNRSGRLAHLQPRNPRADPLDCVTTNDCNCRTARLVAHARTFRHNDTHYATLPRPAPQVGDILLMLLSMNQHHVRR